MLITARAEYACLAMLELAIRHADPRPVRLTDLTGPHGIPQKFVVQILLQMKTAGLVNTTRGAAGGYQLARPPEQITLADIFSALDRMELPQDKPGSTSDLGRNLQAVWRGLGAAHQAYLSRFKLSELVPNAAELMYSI